MLSDDARELPMRRGVPEVSLLRWKPSDSLAAMSHHVAFIVNNYPPHVGGVESHVFALATSLVEAGHRATVVTLSDDPGETNEAGVDVIRLRGHLPIASVISFPSPGTGTRISRLLVDRGITVVSTHTRFFPMSLVGSRVARRLGVPTIHTEHGSGFVKGVSPVIGLASRAVDVSLGRFVLRRADRVLAVSESVADFSRRLSGVDSEIFYNAIDLRSWPEVLQPDPKLRLLFVGRLVPGKGLDTLLRAAAILRSTTPELEFVIDIMGDGPERGRLEALANDLALRELVHWHGRVSQAELPALMRSGILINPTVLSEGFQTSLLEALAGGCRIVSYPVPGLDRLQEAGAPIVRVDDRTPDALAEGVTSALSLTSPPFTRSELDQWGWVERTRQYVRVLESVSAGRTSHVS